MNASIFGAAVKEITPEVAREYQTYILAVEERRSESKEYFTITYYNIIQEGSR